MESITKFKGYDTTVDSSKGKAVGTHTRIVSTTCSPAWEAKNRYNLPESMDMKPETIHTIFEAAGCKQMFAQSEALQSPQSPQSEPTPEQQARQASTAPEATNDEEAILVRYFVGIGKLQEGQGLGDLPENLKAALKARPEAALKKALNWDATH